jgi:tetratricopeptide (TPR) repeat protein
MHRAESLIFHGFEALRKNRPDEAFEFFESSHKEDESSAIPLAWMGHIKATYFKDDAGAEKLFNAAIEADASYSETYLFFAELLFRHERFAELNAVINKASAISGVSKDKVNHFSGLLNEAQGKFEEAVSFYKKAILSSFDNELINVYEKAIERCNLKKKYS